ncbi:protein SHORT HYPOCOTYL IN WHITE LIGHT 1-like isoform X2 [Nymphaea colorata]|uniref:protein SHORT HYPOCOTYL IN WHITE LIGHT 1-like isoform X2 n=1 Tax=Nymphaea colorata TaxID=210225 RepID=UPI00129D2FBB|nr:protein SHORT HYPOCOTYL IN WHITE LIGHT 1-like isoform X2 [Nymphaea colorata]
MAATHVLLQWNPTNLRPSPIPLSSPSSPSSSSSYSISGLVFKHPIARPRYLLPLEASRRISGYSQEDGLSFGGRGGFDRFDVGEEVEDDGEDEDEEEDRSLDLLVQFVQNVFRKVSRRARKAVRSMLPRSIPSKLVVCTLGSIVFVCILVTRGVWSALMYHQEYRRSKFGDMDDDGSVWSGAQPAT